MCSVQMSQDELRKAIVGIQMDSTIDEAEKAARRQALLTGKWKPGDGDVKPKTAVAVSADATTAAAIASAAPAAGAAAAAPAAADPVADGTANANMFDESLKCAICMDLCVRPVTAPCQHNFCLGCFTKWTQQGKRSCPTCRSAFPNRFAENARVNTALVLAIRVAKAGGTPRAAQAALRPPKPQVRLIDRDRPLEAFVTERAQRSGRANAASGRILVTIPADWFGPIPASHCPEPPHSGERGVEVGDTWADRLDCRQYGAHFPHVAGIAGQSHCGAQSVVLSGGYSDDVDEGEYFLYTGSGGRDLSGNKRIAKHQSKHQTFTSSNEALRRSCELGLPVRVVRSHKEKRSAYAPSAADAEAGRGLRYDGIYKIVAAYRRPGAQLSPDGQRFLVCRYVFVRCDNEAAPWSEDCEGRGDDPRDRRPDAAGRGWTPDGLPAAAIEDMRSAVTVGDGEEAGVTVGGPVGMSGQPLPVVTRPDPSKAHWDFDAATGKWGWLRPQPASTKGDRNAAPKTADGAIARGGVGAAKALRVKANNAERALAKEFTCKLCSGVLSQPLSMPCGHHFCGPCLEKNFAGVDAAERAAQEAALAGGRPLRARRFPKPCPKCKADCAASLEDARPNLAMAEVIAKLQESVTAARAKAAEIEKGMRRAKEAAAGGVAAAEDDDDDEEEKEEAEEEEDQEEEEAEAAEERKKDEAGPSNAAAAAAAPAAAAAAPAAAPAPPAPPTAAERAAAAAAAALAQLKAELGPELAASVPEFFLQEALDGHDGNVKAASIEVRMTLQAQARAEKKALKGKAAAAAEVAGGGGGVEAASPAAAAPAAAAAGPSKPSAAKGKRPASAAADASAAPAPAAAPAAAAAPPAKRGRGRPKKQQ